jgi:hypothetical protein
MSLTTLERPAISSVNLIVKPAGDGRAAVAIAIVVFAALSLTAAVTSPGFLEADSCTHYLYARAAWAHPAYIANVWGRPVCTALYATPAHLGGRVGVRAMSLLVAIGVALVAAAVARGQGWDEGERGAGRDSKPAWEGESEPLKRVGGRWFGTAATLAVICTLAQPLVFLHSFSELTELPFALLLALAFWAYQRRQFLLMAVVAGVMPLSRPEGFGFIALAAVALVLHRRWWWAVLLPVPLVLWDYAGWRLYGMHGPWPGAFPFFPWLRANWPYAQTSLYDRKPLLHFVALLPAVISPLLFPAMVVGAWLGLRQWRAIVSVDHRRRCELLIAGIPLMILIGHSLLSWRGKMASNGELRYMLVVAMFWGLLAARGWSWIFRQMQWRRALGWAAAAALAPVIANRCFGVVPIRSQPDWTEAQQIARWYAADGRMQRYPHLLIAHPGIGYYLDGVPGAAERVGDWQKTVVDGCPSATLLIWDPIYSVYNSDSARSVTLAEVQAHGWQPLATPWDGAGSAGKWQAFVSPARR